MIEKQNRIIIVDNSPQELKRLGNAFLEIGIGCRTFLYTQDYDEEPLKNVRIAFFDINLGSLAEIVSSENKEELKKNNSKVLNELAVAINQFVSPENGPYILIFWTKNKDLVDVFKEYINEREIDILNPLQIFSIDKFDFEGEKVNTLPEKILEIINSNEQIKFLFDLQENCRKAGEETINRLYQIIPKDKVWGENQIFFQNLDIIFSKIASSTLGCEHAKEKNQKAIYEGLLPIINYELINSENVLDWNQILTKLNTSTNCRDITIADKSIQNKLNTLYHIEEFVDQKRDSRGSLIEIDKNSIEPLRSLNIENTNDWISKTIPFRDQNTEGIKKRRLEILSNSKIIAIEISAACDFSNKKSRINKYILGILTTNLNDKLDSDLNLKNKPENSYHLGGCGFYYNEKPCHIWVNLNYVFSAKPDDPRFGETLFVLKKEIMDMLGNKYASHISRIGITSL